MKNKMTKAETKALREAFEAEIRKLNPDMLFIARYPRTEPAQYWGKYKHSEIESMWQGFVIYHKAREVIQQALAGADGSNKT